MAFLLLVAAGLVQVGHDRTEPLSLAQEAIKFLFLPPQFCLQIIFGVLVLVGTQGQHGAVPILLQVKASVKTCQV